MEVRPIRSVPKPVPLLLGSSASLQLGQDVLVMGKPTPFGYTVSKGLVFAVGHPLVVDGSRPVQAAILTDALIEEGTAGGPLFNSAGQVVGMASSPRAPAGSKYRSLGQAIPADSIARRVRSILEHGHVRRPHIGIRLEADGSSQRFGLSGKGVVISEVQKGTAADEVGMKTGDVITAVGSYQITCADDIVAALDESEPGEQLRLVVLRPEFWGRDGNIVTSKLQFLEVELWISLQPDFQQYFRA